MTSAVREQEPIWKRVYDAINLQDHTNIRDPYGVSTLGQRWQDKTIGKEWREGQMADVWDLLPDEWKPGVAEWGKGMAEKFGTAWMDARTLEGKEWLDPGKIAAAGTARTLEAIGIPFELLAQATSQATGLDIELSRLAADFIPVGGAVSKLAKVARQSRLAKRVSQLQNLAPNELAYLQSQANKIKQITQPGGKWRFVEDATGIPSISGAEEAGLLMRVTQNLDDFGDVPPADIRRAGEIVTSPTIHKDIIDAQQIPTQVDIITGEVSVVPGTRLGVIDEAVYNRTLKRPLAPKGSGAANQQALLALYWKGIGMKKRMPYWSQTEQTRRVYTAPHVGTTTKLETLFKSSAIRRDRRYGKLLSSEDFIETLDDMYGDRLFGQEVYTFAEDQMTKLNRWMVNQPRGTFQRDHIWPVSDMQGGYRHYNNFIALLVADNLLKSNRKINMSLARELGIPYSRIESIQSTLKSGINRIPPEEVARLILEDLEIIPIKNQIGPPRPAVHKWDFELEAEAIIKELGEETLPQTAKALEDNISTEYLYDLTSGMSTKDLNKKYGTKKKRTLNYMQPTLAYQELLNNPNILERLQKARRGTTPGNTGYGRYTNPSDKGLE